MKIDQEKIKQAFKLLKESFLKEEKFADVKAVDGTIIRYEGDLAVGTAVMAVTEAGAIALPDGDVELEDGTMFTVVDGVISSITPAEAPQDAPADAGQQATAQSTNTNTIGDTAQVKSMIESIVKETRFEKEEELSNKVAELETKIAEFTKQKEEFSKKVTDKDSEIEGLNKKVDAMFELMENLANEPSAAPVEQKKKFSVSEFRKSFKQDLRDLKNYNKK